MKLEYLFQIVASDGWIELLIGWVGCQLSVVRCWEGVGGMGWPHSGQRPLVLAVRLYPLHGLGGIDSGSVRADDGDDVGFLLRGATYPSFAVFELRVCGWKVLSFIFT